MSLVQQFANLFQRRPVDNVPGSTPDGAAPGAPSLADDSLLPGQALAPSELPSVALPLLGNAPAVVQQRRMLAVLGLGLVLLASGSVWMLVQSDRSAQQLAVNGQALMHSQRLTHWTSQAVNGDARAFDRVKDSARTLVRSVRGLARGDNRLGVAAVDTSHGKVLKEITSLMQRADKAAKVVLAQQEALTQTADALRTVNRQSVELLELAEALSTLSLQKGATPAQMATVGQLSVLTQRIGKSVNELQTAEGSVSEVVSLLGKDLELFKQMSLSLLEGNAELRLPATRDAPTRAQLQAVIALYEQARTGVTVVQDNVDGLVAAREARKTIHGDSEPLRRQLETLQEVLRAQSALGAGPLVLLGLAGLCLLLGGMGIVRVQQLDSRQRQMLAEQLQQHGPRHDQEAQRANDVNQAAIVRLMDELQAVAEGDLTQQASVTEDITGALADSVNHTVQELRVLVGSVQNTALRVAQTSTQVDSTSTGLLAAATEQLGEIRETGRAVFEMAQRINQVSAQAQESATVASQSLQAADQGLKAVLNTIGGMNSIRDQIQDTAKRIKRLGESSQEIGEITELISDITEQTNVLALNAAIQAASAGEAGRGFSVVAEEVQRLAERSADATRQIALLVKAIQTDTQDAVAAMERSTQGVVQGAQLSDTAGTALGEIDSVARRLAELIAQIAQSTSSEAELANGLANNIQQIFVVTEQTVDGTRSTAQQVRELAQLAEELRQSVARFKIA